MNIRNIIVSSTIYKAALIASFCLAPALAQASADGCVQPEMVSYGTLAGASSCVDVRGSGTRIDQLRGGAKLQAGVSVYGTVYIAMPNGTGFFTAVQLYDNSRGSKANNKWSTMYNAGYSVPKGQVCAYFYEWYVNQWVVHSPACINIK